MNSCENKYFENQVANPRWLLPFSFISGPIFRSLKIANILSDRSCSSLHQITIIYQNRERSGAKLDQTKQLRDNQERMRRNILAIFHLGYVSPVSPMRLTLNHRGHLTALSSDTLVKSSLPGNPRIAESLNHPCFTCNSKFLVFGIIISSREVTGEMRFAFHSRLLPQSRHLNMEIKWDSSIVPGRTWRGTITLRRGC